MKEIFLALDNIRSAENVGSILRTAEASGADKVFLCGITPTLENKKVLKASLKAEESLKIEHRKNIRDLVTELKSKDMNIYSLEITSKSRDYKKAKYLLPLLLIVGNEVSGVSQEVLKESDQIIKIPMRGKKNSLNVAVATGIVLYEIASRKYL
ncbi:MAG: TrmH family RNA methyltransferase [Patescibacteria group bacterium]|nr:TrmH family RNA methyltransferase [Patescibacteria group bacterium]